MYNLLVFGNEDAWDGEPCFLEIGRCVREYTDDDITKKFGDLTDDQVQEIKRFPCIFAYESGHKKDPKFGLIRNVTKRLSDVKIEYVIMDFDPFLSHSDLSTMQFDLDIKKFEMNRTHWAIKDVNLSKKLSKIEIELPHWARGTGKSVDITNHEFDVALSFPGEIRDYVEPIAANLECLIGPNSCFYDRNYTAQLARPSLDTLLQDIYRNRSKLVVVFLCEKYQERQWCGIEFRAIKEIIMERKNEKIMLVKMDDGKVDGVFKTDGYIDGRKFSPSDMASFIRERLSHLV